MKPLSSPNAKSKTRNQIFQCTSQCHRWWLPSKIWTALRSLQLTCFLWRFAPCVFRLLLEMRFSIQPGKDAPAGNSWPGSSPLHWAVPAFSLAALRWPKKQLTHSHCREAAFGVACLHILVQRIVQRFGIFKGHITQAISKDIFH